MPSLPRRGSLDIAEDLDFQRGDWRAQRAGWICITLVLLAALAGFLGGGPLSRAVASTADGALSVEYQRFERFQSPTQLTVRFGGAVIEDGSASIWIDRDYSERMRIEHVVPQPESVEIGPNRLTYRFRVGKDARRGAATFHVQFRDFGWIAARFGGADGSLTFGQLVYP